MNCVATHLDVEADAISLAPIPTGIFNDSYYILANGQEYVLRVAPPRNAVFCFYEREMMRQEPYIHRLLLENTTVPVARIYAFDDSHDIIPRDFLIMQRLPGIAMTELVHVDEDAVLRQVGEALAETHAQKREAYGYVGEHHPMEPQSSWVDAFLIMWRKLVDDVVSVGYYDDEERALMLRTLDKYMKLFDRPVGPSLLHMDVWAQNILVEGGNRLTGVLDWDRALWGDPEIEFAVLDYCGISKPAFWEGYGSPRDDSAEARVRNFFYLLYEMQKYIVIRHGRSHDAYGAMDYKRQVMQIIRRIQKSD
ncbi:MAG TPA: aminoglycoside phosphotransferase family protein [Candidatus Hydrogenedentes bacterium]|nr:aminoglycoside phosphotransferase family protein [Candidatus Hydrogenedentota bacterium]